MREDTWHFEVEVLGIYGRQELWLHGLARAWFQSAPTSLLTLQTCGGGLRLGRVKIMNPWSGTAACMIGRAGLLWVARACHETQANHCDGQLSERARRSGSTTNRIFRC